MSIYQGLVKQLSDEELHYLFELAYQVYEDGNLFEWFGDVTDTDLEDMRPLFEKVTAFMQEH